MMKLIYPLTLVFLVSLGVSIGQGVRKKKDENVAAIQAILSDITAVKVKQERKILIFSITNGYRHKSIDIGSQALEMLGKETGAYATTISNDLSNFEPGTISQFDAIVFLNTTGEVFSPHKKISKTLTEQEKNEWVEREQRLKKSMMEFIKSGKGFIGIHSATDTFYQWEEYGEMLGARFDSHPWRSKDQVSIHVPPEATMNPLVSFLSEEGLEFEEEIYQYKKPLSQESTLLLRLNPEKNDFSKSNQKKTKNIPVSWVKSHGEGRVFYSSIGHNKNMFTDRKLLQHYLNGIQWAIGDLTH